MKCFKCGADLPDGAKFCKFCGSPQQQQAPMQQTYVQQPYMQPAPPVQTVVKKNSLGLIIALIIAILLIVGLVLYIVVFSESDGGSSSSKKSKNNSSSAAAADSEDDDDSKPAKTTTTTTMTTTTTTTKKKTTTTTTAPPPTVNLKSYGIYEYNGHYYKAFANGSGFSFDEAHKACVKMGGELVSINSQGEQDFIVYTVMNGMKNYWIGLVRSDSSWRWLDGSRFDYTNWDMFVDDEGDEQWQPDNYEESEDVVRIAGADQQFEYWRCNKGGWLDSNRYGDSDAPLSEFGYICEWTSVPDVEGVFTSYN